MGRRSIHAGTVALAACVGAVLAACPASAAAAPVTTKVGRSPAQVRQYWTTQRMRSARPASMLQGGPLDLLGLSGSSSGGSAGKATQVNRTSSYPNRTNGKVFFTIPLPAADAGDYECSGTAVRSPSHSLVWTAGHCGYDAGPFPLFCDCTVKNFEFVPAYHDGAKPYGEWAGRKIANPSQWRSDGDSAFDFTAATVARRNGRRLQDVVGGRRIAFGQPRRVQYKAYGYPAAPPFDGEHLYRCVSAYQGADNSEGPPPPIRIRCDMNEGSSGGAWVIRRPYHGHFRHYLVSIASYGYVDDPDHLYGPYQGTVARNLYRRAGG
jgi:hypothetical protein